MNEQFFDSRGIDRFYIEGKDHSFHRQNRLEVNWRFEAASTVDDLERAGFEVVVCEFPMSRWSLNHVVVYASTCVSKRFAISVAHLVELGKGRIVNKMFINNGIVSDKPIANSSDIKFVTPA